ncbi:MAG: MmcQ/YjbR family DNA-binding protein [Alphaproteobacteria bacterium]|nr:MmcQ/YjbR family DNA-binding protein [Alphaproteobacteria bacterium]
MTYPLLEGFLLQLPGASLTVQWGEDRVFKVGGKMFAVIGVMNGKPRGLSFKAGEESFEILTALPGITPAPYLARAKWVRLESPDALPLGELQAYLARSHGLMAAGLTKKARAALGL